MIEVEKGVALPKSKDLKVLGIKHKEVDNVLGKGANDLLFDKTYQIIYGFK